MRIKKETPQAYIRRLRINLQSEKTTCQQMYLNYPDRIYKVGERVQYGNWNWTHVLEVYDGGRYYKVVNITSSTPYGIYKGEVFQINYLSYPSLLPYRTLEEKQAPVILRKNEDLRLDYSQRDIYGILHTYYGAGIDLNPDYQRGNVWSFNDKILLIESIFKNIDIGKFTLIKRPFEENAKSYEILDGKQRIITLLEFFEDRFKFKGLKFSELHWLDQNHFENYYVSYSEASPMSNEQKYRYFINLNVTGKPIDPKHIERVKKLLFVSQMKKEKS